MTVLSDRTTILSDNFLFEQCTASREKTLLPRFLDLIDRMLQFGEYSLSQVLAEYDRREQIS